MLERKASPGGDFPGSGENVCEADKRGPSLAGKAVTVR